MLKAVFLPALFLVFAVARILIGEASVVTVIVLLSAIAWLAIAIQQWRASQESAEPRAEIPPQRTAPPERTPEETAQLRASLDIVRRMQRENSAPPPRLPTEEEILATARPAIFLHRTALPVPLDHPGRSYLGGNPRLPPELDWPDALPFLAQIDLAELPRVESPLPREGTLYFFTDVNLDCPEPSHCRVLYYAGDASSLPYREPPEEVRAYSRESASFGFGCEPWAWLPATSPWARTPFRFPFTFTAFDSVRDYLIEPGASSPPLRNRQVFDGLMAAEFTRRFGAGEPAPDIEPWKVFQEDRDDWPFAWAAIDYGARSIVNEIQQVLISRAGMEARSEYQAISDAASKWIERAAQEPPQARCEDSVRDAFAKEWRTLAADFTSLSKSRNVHKRMDNRDLRDVLIAACYTCASHGAASVIPDRYRRALEGMNDVGSNFRRYQMLGHGEKVQWAPIEHEKDVLLLQLFGDGTLGWEADSGCVFQFWISQEALGQCKFESAEMTLESD